MRPVSAQLPGDRSETLSASGRVDVQPEVREVDREPRILQQVTQLTSQPQVVSGDAPGDRDVVDLLAELIDADTYSPVMQPPSRLEGVCGGGPDT